MKKRKRCVICGGSTYALMVCPYCITKSPFNWDTNSKKKKEVKKLIYSNCEACKARKVRKQKVKDVVFTAVKAGFAAAFQLVATVGAVWLLLTEGVILS